MHLVGLREMSLMWEWVTGSVVGINPVLNVLGSKSLSALQIQASRGKMTSLQVWSSEEESQLETPRWESVGSTHYLKL